MFKVLQITDIDIASQSPSYSENINFPNRDAETVEYVEVPVTNLVKLGMEVEPKGIGYPFFYRKANGTKGSIYINNKNGVFETEVQDKNSDILDIEALYVPFNKFKFTLIYMYVV